MNSQVAIGLLQEKESQARPIEAMIRSFHARLGVEASRKTDLRWNAYRFRQIISDSTSCSEGPLS